jgi:Mn-dependent DtxR family transcriptional regulator
VKGIMSLKEKVKEFFRKQRALSNEEIAKEFKISLEDASRIVDELKNEGYIEDPPHIHLTYKFPKGFLRAMYEKEKLRNE